MSRRIIAGYLVFCILSLVGLLSYATVRLVGTWNKNREAAETELSALAREASPYYLTTLDFADQAVLGAVREAALKRPRLISLTIYSRRDGVYYISARQREAAPVRPSSDVWTGNPRYGNLPRGTIVVTRPFVTGTEANVIIDGVFSIMAREDIFPVLKEVFIILLCFFVATLVVLMILPSTSAPHARPQSNVTPRPKESKSSQVSSDRSTSHSPELFNSETGLGWEHHVEHRLKYELERAASFDQDLVLTIIELAGSQRHRRAYVRAASIITHTFPFHDLAFEFGPTRYAVILPDHDLDQGIESLELLKRNLPRALSVCAGLTSRNGRLVSEQRLMTEAEGALKRAIAAGAGWVEAFKADPEKYREMVAERSAKAASERQKL